MTRDTLFRLVKQGIAKNLKVDRSSRSVEAYFPRRLDHYDSKGRAVYYGDCTIRLLAVDDEWLDRFEQM